MVFVIPITWKADMRIGSTELELECDVEIEL
jgi:hypothetical protein